MDIELINPVVLASYSVLEMVLNTSPSKGPLSVRPSNATGEQVSIACGITGQIQGQVVYGMSLVTADRVASAMLGQTVTTFDSLAASAVAELGNMISGNASLLLSELGYQCDITPPAVIRGANIEISTVSIPAVVIPLTLEQGEIFLTVGVRKAAGVAGMAKAA